MPAKPRLDPVHFERHAAAGGRLRVAEDEARPVHLDGVREPGAAEQGARQRLERGHRGEPGLGLDGGRAGRRGLFVGLGESRQRRRLPVAGAVPPEREAHPVEPERSEDGTVAEEGEGAQARFDPLHPQQRARLGGPRGHLVGVQPQSEAGCDPEPADRDRAVEGVREPDLDLAPQALRSEASHQREAGAERRRKGQQGEPPSQAHASHSALRGRSARIAGRPRRGGGALQASDPNLGFAEPTRARARRPHLRALTALVGAGAPATRPSAKVASSLKNSRVRSKRLAG